MHKDKYDKIGLHRKTYYLLRNLKRQRQLKKLYYNEDPSYPQNNFIVFMADGRNYHGGLTDRLRAAVGTFAVAKEIGRPFRIHFTTPFKLEKYLEPNNYDWRITNDELNYNSGQSHPIVLFSEVKGTRLFRLTKKRQHHIYSNRDLLDVVNKRFGTNYNYKDTFNLLFKPTPLLQKELDRCNEIIGKNYVSVCFRFQQLLGDNHEGDYPVLNDVDKAELIDSCLSELNKIISSNEGMNILITSDSETFLNLVKDLPGVFTFTGKMNHIEYQNENDELSDIKGFIDMYTLAGSKKIYTVIVEKFNMFYSGFPLYASRLGNIPFERIVV